MSAAIDYMAGGEAAYTGASVNDTREAAQMQPFAQRQDVPWWQSLVMYGATRAIDNRFGPTQVQGNTNPGSFAGQNGRTYANTPTGQGGMVAPAASFGGLPLWALLAAGGVVAFLALRKG